MTNNKLIQLNPYSRSIKFKDTIKLVNERQNKLNKLVEESLNEYKEIKKYIENV